MSGNISLTYEVVYCQLLSAIFLPKAAIVRFEVKLTINIVGNA